MSTTEMIPMIVMPFILFAVIWQSLRYFQEKSKMRSKERLHQKLVDRFSSAKEMSEFFGTEGGTELLKSLSMEVSTFKERLLSGIQNGIIIASLGVALIFISRLAMEGRRVVEGFGIVCLAVGIGYLISTTVSIYLGRKWDLWSK